MHTVVLLYVRSGKNSSQKLMFKDRRRMCEPSACACVSYMSLCHTHRNVLSLSLSLAMCECKLLAQQYDTQRSKAKLKRSET